MSSASEPLPEMLIDRLQAAGGLLTHSEAETVEVGLELGRAIAELANPVSEHPAPVILLEGEMGAGKTALVRGFATGLGVDPRLVQSPTFTLLNEYEDGQGLTRLVHGDLYRLEPEEVEGAGILDALLKEDGAVIIEWSERLPQAVPGAVTLRLSRLIAEPAKANAKERERGLSEASEHPRAEPGQGTAANTRRIEWISGDDPTRTQRVSKQ